MKSIQVVYRPRDVYRPRTTSSVDIHLFEHHDIAEILLIIDLNKKKGGEVNFISEF
jgi:hypothetical protein